MFTDEAERICRMIDQRNADMAAVRNLERMAEPPALFWTGVMTVSNRKVTVFSGLEPIELDPYARAQAAVFRPR